MSIAPPPRPDAETAAKPRVVPAQFIYPFILVTTLFALWGFANDVTNPLVRAFKEIFIISNEQSAWVQRAFYGGYATMAIPAALVIRKISYKSGILIGLGLYAIGALLTLPASHFMSFNVFLVGFYVLTFGLAFLETSANPYVLALGDSRTATQRLNLAQAFNPMGSLTGMVVASMFVLPSLQVAEFRNVEREAHPEYAEMLPSEVDGRINEAWETFTQANPEAYQEIVSHDLGVVTMPYIAIACVVAIIFAIFAVSKLPDMGEEKEQLALGPLVRHLCNFRYLGGVVAQTFYVGAQIMCWTFIIHYGMTLVGLSAAQAQNYNIVAMVLFLTSRFICTFLLRFLQPGLLLGCLAVGACCLILGAIFLHGMPGLYCLVGVSGCMSLMFPTIYGIALDGLTPNDAKLGSAGLIFAIVGGALMPNWQGALIDGEGMEIGGRMLESVRVSFVLPLVCFVIIALYGFFAQRLIGKSANRSAA
ncbi:L-fucose:H+ symporter permease [Pelagicoccus sp. SDUM812003]|uniref:L-fucose:H+ symporter permease n=1 Tax=Pelagicoccus sp. SDUM812003 TaxID=3041267 RepID=UPI00280D70C2|nr:L-fucose:H+ symporter permease [Pelagicoccus sp. SDUM812003]MDQ8203232.1 L-fucose:H+ symporter permease [Pelagicoccus sp. SDUM812003]